MTMNSSDVILGWIPISHLRQIETDITGRINFQES